MIQGLLKKSPTPSLSGIRTPFRGDHFPLLTALILCLITVIIHYPGHLSVDSADQLLQARLGNYSDWHPPVMGWVWGLLDRIIPGPAGMLLLHNFLFWTGLGLTASLVAGNSIVAHLSVLVIGLNPSVFALLGTIWKDVSFASALLFSFSLLLYAERKKSKLAFILCAFPLFYASTVRHNALPAALPFAVWIAASFGKVILGSLKPPRREFAFSAGIGLLIVIFSGVHVLNRSLTHGKTSYPLQQIFVHDLTAISIQQQENYLPAYTSPSGVPFSIDHLKKLYSRDEVVPLFCCGNDGVQRIPMIDDPKRMQDLKAAWLKVVPHHIGPYLIHRLRVFGAQLSVRRKDVCNPYHLGIVENRLGLEAGTHFVPSWLLNYLSAIRNTIFFRGAVYLVLLTLLTGYGLRRFGLRRLDILCVSTSGLAYFLPYFFVSSTCDFRLHWWCVIVTWILPLLIFFDRAETLRGQDQPI